MGTKLEQICWSTNAGGVTLDGPRILQEAREEIQKIEEEMSLRYELPVNMMVG